MKDAISLSLGLKGFGLEKLIIQASCIDDDKCRLLCHALLTNTKLHYLGKKHIDKTFRITKFPIVGLEDWQN
jgi:hypothetical protein